MKQPTLWYLNKNKEGSIITVAEAYNPATLERKLKEYEAVGEPNTWYTITKKSWVSKGDDENE